MKKLFSFAFVAMMSVAMLSLVGCNKNNKPDEPTWETPTVLTGTTWISGEGSSFEATLIFETETAGKRTVHNVINGKAYDTETAITYTYKDGEGSYTDDRENTYEFTIDGGTLTAQESSYEEIYLRKK